MRRQSPTAVYLGLELILSAAFAVSFTVTAVYFVKTVHLDPLQLVLAGTAMEATIFVCEIPTGVLADTYGRRASLVLGWAISGAAMVLVGAVPHVAAVLAGFALWGFGYTFTSGAYEAWITDEVGAARVTHVFVRGTRMGYAGALAGIGLSVSLAAWLGLGTTVAIGGGLVILCAAYAALAMPETGFRPTGEERPGWRDSLQTARRGGRLVRGHPLLMMMMAITLFAGMSSESFDRLWQAHFIRDVGLPSFFSLDDVYWFGLFEVGSMVIGLVASTVLVRRFRDRPPVALARMLLVVTVVQLAAAILFGIAGGVAFALSTYWLYRLTRGLVHPLYMGWLNRNIDDSSVRATVISMEGQADAVGQTAGGPVLGAIGNAWGIPAALLAGAAVLAPAILLYGRATRHDGLEPELEELPATAPV